MRSYVSSSLCSLAESDDQINSADTLKRHDVFHSGSK